MDEDYWQRTREILQSDSDPLFKRPRLTETLLRRPPFRFIHDVVTAVQRKTGFADGVFTETELDSKALDREGKIAYLRKLVEVVEAAGGGDLDVDPPKIVAGLEPERTNALLQTLGKVARLSSDASEEVAVPSSQKRPPSRRHPSERGSDPFVGDPPPQPDLERQVDVLRLEESRPTEETVNSAVDAPAFIQSAGDGEISDKERDGSGSESREQPGSRGSRPQTAKKPPPPSRPRSRRETPLRPSSARGVRSRPASAVGTAENRQPALTQRSASSHSDADDAPASRHTEGALVRNLKQEETYIVPESQSQGVLLRKKGGMTNKAQPLMDLEGLINGVGQFEPLAVSLGRCLENLVDAAEPMQKELRFWESEAKIYREQLQSATHIPDKISEMQKVQDIEEELEETASRIRSLKETVEHNQTRITEMLQSMTA